VAAILSLLFKYLSYLNGSQVPTRYNYNSLYTLHITKIVEY